LISDNIYYSTKRFKMMPLSHPNWSYAFRKSITKSRPFLFPTTGTLNTVSARLLHGLCRSRLPLSANVCGLNYQSYSRTSPAEFLCNVRLTSNIAKDVKKQPIKDISYYNSAIDGFYSKGDLKSVKKMFEDLKEARVRPNASTMISLVTAHSHYSDVQGCAETLLFMSDNGLAPCATTLRCLLKMYSLKGDSHSCETTFSALQSLDSTICSADCNAVIYAYSINGNTDGCQTSINKMKSFGFKEDVTMMNSLINACSRNCDPNGAVRVLKNMESMGIIPNESTYNTVIGAFCSGDVSKPAAAEQLLKELIQSGVTPSKMCRNSVINCYLSKLDLASAERSLRDMHDSGMVPDKRTLDALILAYSKEEKNAESVQRVIDFMKAVGIAPDPANMNCLVLAYANEVNPEGADRTIEQMKTMGIEVNKYTLTSRLKAYALTGNPTATRRVLDEIVADGYELNKVAVNTYLSSFKKPTGSVDWDGLMQCWEEFFVSGRFEADEYTYNHFLMACLNTNRKDDAELWFSRLLSFTPSPSKYSINIFRRTVQQDRFIRYCSYQSPAIRDNLNHSRTPHSLERQHADRNKPPPNVKRWTKAAGFTPAQK
jgi:pentatricopeptide repeat protein